MRRPLLTLTVEDEDQRVVRYHRLMAWYTEYPEEGAGELGPELSCVPYSEASS